GEQGGGRPEQPLAHRERGSPRGGAEREPRGSRRRERGEADADRRAVGTAGQRVKGRDRRERDGRERERGEERRRSDLRLVGRRGRLAPLFLAHELVSVRRGGAA